MNSHTTNQLLNIILEKILEKIKVNGILSMDDFINFVNSLLKFTFVLLMFFTVCSP